MRLGVLDNNCIELLLTKVLIGYCCNVNINHYMLNINISVNLVILLLCNVVQINMCSGIVLMY